MDLATGIPGLGITLFTTTNPLSKCDLTWTKKKLKKLPKSKLAKNSRKLLKKNVSNTGRFKINYSFYLDFLINLHAHDAKLAVLILRSSYGAVITLQQYFVLQEQFFCERKCQIYIS